MGIGFMGPASKINAASQIHTCSHTKQGVGRWTCFTNNTVGWKRHTDIFYVCNFKSSFLFLNNNGFIVVSALFSKKPFQHLVWDRLSILSIHLCLVTPSSPQNSCVPPLTLSCQAGLGSLARLSLPWKGMARGGGGVTRGEMEIRHRWKWKISLYPPKKMISTETLTRKHRVFPVGLLIVKTVCVWG